MNALELERAEYIKCIITEMEQAGRGEKGEIIRRATDYLCCSKDKLYQAMADLGWQSGRKKRVNNSENALSKEETELLANLMRQSERDSGKRLMSVQLAVEVAYSNGRLRTMVSESTVLRAFKRFGLHPDKLNIIETTTGMRSLYPNHAWQFDVSICVLYYLKSGKGLQVMPESEFYKNKPNNLERIRKERVLRYLATDHYSGAFFLRYYVAPGENTETITQFLFESFCERKTGELMYGVPKILIWDAGSANIAHQTRHMLGCLDVKHIAHTPGRPWAKGQVESTHNIVERNFESLLAFKTIDSIEMLNEYAIKWSISFQSIRKHSRHKATRYGVWQTVRAENLRIIPDIELVKSLMQQTKPEVRKVRSHELSISYAPKGYGSLDYSLSDIKHISGGDEVTVYVNPFSPPAIRVVSKDEHGNKHTHEVAPIKRDAVGFNESSPVVGEEHKSVRDAHSDTYRKQLDTKAWGTDNPRQIKKIRKGKVPAFNGAIDPMAHIEQQATPAFMQRKGKEMIIGGEVLTTQKTTFIGTLKRVKSLINPSKIEFNGLKALLKQRYPEGASELEISAFIKNWEQEHAHTQAANK